MEERKCFICGGFGHIIYYYKNREEKGSVLMLSNRFEVLKNRMMQRREDSRKNRSRKKEKR